MDKSILQTACKRCAKDCHVLSAKIACILTAPDYTHVTVNKRGGILDREWTLHAERLMCDKIKRERWPYPGECNITVIRFRKDGSLACARPCSMCDKVLRKTGVRHVWYTNEMGVLERLF
mgnify:CR=1 FL=1